MAHTIRARVDLIDAPTDSQTRFKTWASNQSSLADSQYYRDHQPRNDGTLQGYIEFRADLPATTDRQAAIDALTTDHFPDASWMAVHCSCCRPNLHPPQPTQTPLRRGR